MGKMDETACIHQADMPDDLQAEAVACAARAMFRFTIEKDIAAHIKREFDHKYKPKWHCVVGKRFGSYVSHDTKTFIYLTCGGMAVLLFKSG